MKKRYKGYFKKPTNLSDQVLRECVKTKREYSKDEKFRIGLWVNTYLKYLNKL